MVKIFRIAIFSVLILCALLASQVNAQQSVNVNAQNLLSRADVYISPRTGSFVEGSTFEVPILIDTKGNSINGIEISVSFDKDKLSIIKPSGGKSIVGVWIEPPKYDNTKGKASYVGVVPGGITTESGLIGTITFKALRTGSAVVSVGSDSHVLLNDGLGTEVLLDTGRAQYDIIYRAPEGVRVFSETHSIQDKWYNNNNPVLSWERAEGVNGFSYEIDNKPSTIPDNKVESEEAIKSFEGLSDGVWYFHIKAVKGSAWGTTGHYVMHIDTAPPASFKPEINYLVAATVLIERTLVSFFTTDNLSGIDRYEVGVIDKTQPVTESPVFVQTESPFQVPITTGSDLRVIVRAIDKAGNIRDESISVHPPLLITKFIKEYLVYILAGIILLGFVMLIIHYVAGRHIIRHLRRAFAIVKKEEAEEVLHQEFTNKPPSV